MHHCTLLQERNFQFKAKIKKQIMSRFDTVYCSTGVDHAPWLAKKPISRFSCQFDSPTSTRLSRLIHRQRPWQGYFPRWSTSCCGAKLRQVDLPSCRWTRCCSMDSQRRWMPASPSSSLSQFRPRSLSGQNNPCLQHYGSYQGDPVTGDSTTVRKDMPALHCSVGPLAFGERVTWVGISRNSQPGDPRHCSYQANLFWLLRDFTEHHLHVALSDRVGHVETKITVLVGRLRLRRRFYRHRRRS